MDTFWLFLSLCISISGGLLGPIYYIAILLLWRHVHRILQLEREREGGREGRRERERELSIYNYVKPMRSTAIVNAGEGI